MPLLEIKDFNKTLKVNTFTKYIPTTHIEIRKLDNLLTDLDARVPLQKFSYKNTNDLNFEYYFKSVDNREWFQNIRFVSLSGEPFMTFSVPNEWKLSEFQAHRELRDDCIFLTQNLDVEKIDCNFN